MNASDMSFRNMLTRIDPVVHYASLNAQDHLMEVMPNPVQPSDRCAGNENFNLFLHTYGLKMMRARENVDPNAPTVIMDEEEVAYDGDLSPYPPFVSVWDRDCMREKEGHSDDD